MSKKIKKLSNYSVAGILGVSGLFGLLIVGLVCPLAESASALGTTSFVLGPAPNPMVSISMNQPIVGDNSLDQVEGLPSSTSFYKPVEIGVGGIKSYYISVFLDCSNYTGEEETKCKAGNLLTDNGNTLKSVDSAKTFSTMNNEWGFRYNIDNNVLDPKDKYFAPLATNKVDGYLQYNGAEQIRTDAPTYRDDKILTLSFGAKVDGNTAAGTYNGKIAVAIVASPTEAAGSAFEGITTMQAMTHNICANASIHDTAYLEDNRDNKKYWVTKLEDGHCWMSQNLDLDLFVGSDGVYAGTFDKYVGNTGGTLSSTGVKLTKSNTDITTDTLSTTLMPNNTTQNVALTGAASNTGNTSKNSWDQGLWVINDPVAGNLCDHNNDGISNCSAMFTNIADPSDPGWVAAEDPNFINLAKDATYKQGDTTYTKTSEAGMAIDEGNHVYDAHYLIGNYYQFNAATASSADETANIDAPDSLCPKGWKLPSSNTMSDVNGRGSFYYMLTKYGIATGLNTGVLSSTDQTGKTTNIALSPLFYVRSGNVNPNETSKFRNAGKDGDYWSARAKNDNTTDAHYFYFWNGANGVYPSWNGWRYFGSSMRCILY